MTSRWEHIPAQGPGLNNAGIHLHRLRLAGLPGIVPDMMRNLSILLLAAAPLAGCSQAHQTPPTSPEPPRPPEKTWLDKTADSTKEAADATWNAVSAPVKWMTPTKKVAATQPVYDAPDAVIVESQADGSRPIMVPLADEPTTKPATTRPKKK
jgi:hypothetical protein